MKAPTVGSKNGLEFGLRHTLTERLRPRQSSPVASRLCVFAILIMSTFATVQPTASQETRVKSQHGDWQKVCKTPPGSKNPICALVQDVTSESNPNVGLSVHFQQSPSGGKVLRVFAPLGILLPPGLGLQIDNQKVGHAPFVRCHVVGCFAQVTLTDDLIDKFQGGETAWFIVFQTKEAGIGIPVSLNGFNEALANLN